MRFLILAAALAVAASGAAAQDLDFKSWTFKKWSVVAYKEHGDKNATCEASAGSGEEDLMMVSYSQAGGLDVYLQHIEIKQRHEPLLSHGGTVTFALNDGSTMGAGVVEAAPVELADGEHYTLNAKLNNPERFVGWMAQAKQIRVQDDFNNGKVFAKVPLAGFPAAYRKMVEQCGAPRELIP